MKKILTILAALALIPALLGCSINITIGHHGSGDAPSGTVEYVPDNGYTAGGTKVLQRDGFRSIDIEWINGSVTIEMYDEEHVGIEEALADGGAVSTPLEWRVHEGTLDIRSQPRLVDLMEEKHLTVRLPRSIVLHELDIETVSADVTAVLPEDDILELDEFDVSTVSGTVTADDVRAAEVSISSTSGALNGSVSAQELDVSTVSGTVEVTLMTLPVEVDVESTSGNVTLHIPGAVMPTAPLAVSFTGTSGKLVCDAAHTLVRDGSWEFKTVSGNVSILEAS